MHYYSFNPSAYTLDTVHLDNDHDLAYRRLLDLYYTSEAPISKETQSVAIRLRCGSNVVLDVLKEFFTETEGGWLQTRCDAEISIYHRKADVARANGKAGGRPKKTKRVNLANRIGTGLQPDGKLTKNYELETNNQEVKESPTPKARKKKETEISDEEWMAQLKANPEYRGIVIESEYSRACEWCSKNSTTLSRRRFTNWLGKAAADKPIAIVAKKPFQSVTHNAPVGGWKSCL